MLELKVKKLHPDAILPMRAYSYDAGADLYSMEEKVVESGEGYKFSTGVACDIEQGFYGQLHTRSSMSLDGWNVVGGVIDSSYKGELSVVLRNMSKRPLKVVKDQRIAQLVLHSIPTPKIVEVNDIGTSERMSNGFGSTGL